MFSGGFWTVCRKPDAVGHDSLCCLAPGTIEGCQGWAADRCYAAKQNVTPCLDPGFNRYGGGQITLEALRDIKAALHGKAVDVAGRVDHSSPRTTPHLQLRATIYTNELRNDFYRARIFGDPAFLTILDGGTLWLDATENYTAAAESYSASVAELRAIFGANFSIAAGNYMRLSGGPCVDYCPVAAFRAILRQSVALYDTGQITGMDIFSGVWMARIPSLAPKMNASAWRLPSMFEELVFPWVGEAQIAIVDADGKPVEGALVTVKYGVRTVVTRRLSPVNGTVTFEGWVGKAQPVPHTVAVSDARYTTVSKRVQLVARTTVSVGVRLVAMNERQPHSYPASSAVGKSDDEVWSGAGNRFDQHQRQSHLRWIKSDGADTGNIVELEHVRITVLTAALLRIEQRGANSHKWCCHLQAHF
jgi:hypothetical protein